MLLLKFNTDYGKLYLVSPKPLRDVNLSLGKPADSVSFDSVKNFVSSIENKFKEEPAPAEEPEKKPEETEEKEPEKKEEKKTAKIALANVIRQYALTLKD